MCEDCAQNGPTMIAGVNLSTYLEADSKKKPWTLKLCPDLGAGLMMALSKRLRSDAMVYYDPNKIPANLLFDWLIKDIGLSFDYKEKLRNVVFRGLMAQAKGILSDAIAWETIFKVENGKDPNLFQWKVGFILNDMTTVENAKKYIMTKRAEEDRVHQERVPPAQGFKEGLDSISASHSSFDVGSAPAGTAADPITLDTDQDEGPSRYGYIHAHAPRVSSLLATVPPYTAADLAAQSFPHMRPEVGFYKPITHVATHDNHQSTPSSAKRRPSAPSTRTARPPSHHRGRRANIS